MTKSQKSLYPNKLQIYKFKDVLIILKINILENYWRDDKLLKAQKKANREPLIYFLNGCGLNCGFECSHPNTHPQFVNSYLLLSPTLCLLPNSYLTGFFPSTFSVYSWFFLHLLSTIPSASITLLHCFGVQGLLLLSFKLFLSPDSRITGA